MIVDLSPEQEASSLLDLHEGKLLPAMDHLEKQLNVVQSRAQVLVSLAGVVVTVTGFSGRLIAGTGRVGQALIVAGLFTVLASALHVLLAAMNIRWITRLSTEDPALVLVTIIRRRDKKTKAYRIGGLVLLAGLALYCLAIAVMLFDP